MRRVPPRRRQWSAPPPWRRSDPRRTAWKTPLHSFCVPFQRNELNFSNGKRGGRLDRQMPRLSPGIEGNFGKNWAAGVNSVINIPQQRRGEGLSVVRTIQRGFVGGGAAIKAFAEPPHI